MKKQRFFSVIVCFFASTTFCMEQSTYRANPKIDALNAIINNISAYKESDTEKYLADMQVVANTLYAITFLREQLFTIKTRYNHCKATEKYVFYDGKLVNGFISPIDPGFTHLIPTIKSQLGHLIEYTPSYGGKEYNIFLTTPEERAFSDKIPHTVTSQDRRNVLKFLRKYVNHENLAIKIMACNWTYMMSSNEIVAATCALMNLQKLFLFDNTQKYLSRFDLKKIFSKEFIITRMAISAFNNAGEAAHSIIQQLEILCNNPVFTEMTQEDNALLDCYKSIIKNAHTTVSDYAHKLINTAKNKKFEHHTLGNQLLKKYLTIAPELETLYKCFGLQGDLPGIWPFEKPMQFIPKQQKPSKKKQTKNLPQNSEYIAPSSHKTSDFVDAFSAAKASEDRLKNKSLGSAVNTVPSLIPDRPEFVEGYELLKNKSLSTSSDAIDTDIICYDNRILQQNTNKTDRYHGFTLITAPYILKYGTPTTWYNKKTNHADTLITINGEIEYTKKNNQKVIHAVQFGLCKGADKMIYHIEMKKRNNKATLKEQTYNAQFPPLGTAVKTYKKSKTDDFGSKVIAETEFMTQILDGGLNATITLYK